MIVYLHSSHRSIFLLILVSFNFVSSVPQNITDKNGRRYIFENENKFNWLEASDRCAREQMQLVVIDSASKNSDVVALLKSAYDSPRPMWIGHHDEFNDERDKSRPFYAAATGAKLTYSSWNLDSPNNSASKEHCVIITTESYKWNDVQCENNYGYICEEHYLINSCDNCTNISEKRKIVNRKNSELSSQFEQTRSEVNEAILAAADINSDLLLDYIKATENNVEEFRNSLDEIFQSKPYLQAVQADIGKSIEQLFVDLQKIQNKYDEEIFRKMKETNDNTVQIICDKNSLFALKLEQNKNDIDAILQ